MISSRTPDELKKIAVDLHHGLLFTDRHLERMEDLPMVFMILALAGKEITEGWLEHPPGLIYEYLSEAGPRAVNGMPCFMSVKLLNVEDAKKVFEIYAKLKEAEKAALGAV